MNRTEQIRALLQEHLSPTVLEIMDESAHHAGHAGARDGAGHFRVRIVAQAFSGATRLQRHRLIYAALGDLMHRDIHALSIEALDPSEHFPVISLSKPRLS